MLTPDAAFEAVTNAAAAAFARLPPRIRYRVDVTIERARTPPTSRAFRVELATATGDAETTALSAASPAPAAGAGAATPADASSAPPAFPIALDALAQWGFRLVDSGGDARLAVAYEHRTTFATASPPPGVDVAVTSVRGYAVSYAAPDHVVLTPATPAMREYASVADDFVYHDVWFDPATLLPQRVVLTAPSETLSLDYATDGGLWVLRHVLDQDASRTHDPAALRRLSANYLLL